MGKKSNSKKEYFQKALNEVDAFNARKQRELMDLQFKIRAKYKNKKQKKLAETIKKNRVTIVTGSPGSGKTFIALKTGLEILKNKEKYKIGDILLTSPILNSPVGFLPGTLDDKLLNYFQHFYDNIDKLVGKDIRRFLKKANLINEQIISFMRGSTFGKYEDGEPIGTYCMLDETQNITPKDVKTYLSRLGENSKIILLGDLEQCDLNLKKNEQNGLQDVIERLDGLDGVGYIHFTEDDIVRDPFLIEIMKRYKEI